MNRLDQHFARTRAAGRKTLSMYLTPFYPEPELTVELALALADAGADIIELGIPFSDPIADGPTIQASSERALRNGATLPGVLEAARAIRAERDLPLVLMGYANPVYAFGQTRFLQACAEIGVDGTIIPDLPLEESAEFGANADAHGVANILLASPTSDDARLEALDQATRGFLYCVSVAGVTGARTSISNSASAFIRRARARVRQHPLLVGFGISTPADAREVAALCDGVIVGSALLSILRDAPPAERTRRAADFTRSLRTALDSDVRP
jgi:tryptophan synthase alpha chain